MQLTSASKMKNIQLPAIDETLFNSESVKGKLVLLSFFRFASCPFCNLRVNELVRRYDEFGDNFTIIAIFDSPLENLKRHTEGHKSPFPILADENNIYYEAYGIKYSLLGMFKGMIFRFPTLLKAMLKGYIPFIIKGSFTTMPADFLIDREGNIQIAYYGKDEGDHLSFDKIKAFSKL